MRQNVTGVDKLLYRKALVHTKVVIAIVLILSIAGHL